MHQSLFNIPEHFVCIGTIRLCQNCYTKCMSSQPCSGVIHEHVKGLWVAQYTNMASLHWTRYHTEASATP